MKKKAMVIINPSSGGEQAGEYRKQIEAKLKTMFEEVEVKETEKEGDAKEFASLAADQAYDAVFAMEQSMKPLMGWQKKNTALFSGSYH